MDVQSVEAFYVRGLTEILDHVNFCMLIQLMRNQFSIVWNFEITFQRIHNSSGK